jgi:hypothetical protein
MTLAHYFVRSDADLIVGRVELRWAGLLEEIARATSGSSELAGCLVDRTFWRSQEDAFGRGKGRWGIYGRLAVRPTGLENWELNGANQVATVGSMPPGEGTPGRVGIHLQGVEAQGCQGRSNETHHAAAGDSGARMGVAFNGNEIQVGARFAVGDVGAVDGPKP